jgi:DNA-binding IscR family transcriptional regulator
MKVVHQLGRLGYVETVRGKGAACGWHARRPLHRALDAFFGVLDEYTLADLIAPARPLARVLFAGHP